MGIDAEIVIEIPDSNRHLDAAAIKKLQYRIVTAMRDKNIRVCLPRHEGQLLREDLGGVPENSQLLEVDTYHRYYGEGYERGDWLQLKGIMELVEFHVPGAVVWYGGDCGLPFTKCDATGRGKIHNHWLSHGRPKGVPSAELGPNCPECDEPTYLTGGRHGSHVYECAGCDYTTEVPIGSHD